MTTQLYRLYKSEQLLNLEVNYSIISIIRTNIIIIKDSLLLHFSYPIFHPVNYNQYKLIPLPLINFTIIPPYPIILLPEDTSSSLWYDEECQPLEEYSLCIDKSPQRIEDTCYEPLLKGQPGLCQQTKINLKRSFIDISYTKLIIVPINESLLIKETCSKHLTTTSISIPTIITLDRQCSTEVKDEIISTPESNLPPQTIILPIPKYSNFTLDISTKPLLYLNDIQRSISELPGVHIRHFSPNSSNDLWIWLTLGAIILLIFLCKCYPRIFSYCNPYTRAFCRITPRKAKKTQSMEKPKSSSTELVALKSADPGPTPKLQPPRNPF